MSGDGEVLDSSHSSVDEAAGPVSDDPADVGSDWLEEEWSIPVHSVAEDGAVAKATTDRLRAEVNRAWHRALIATARRDKLVAEQRRLVAAGRHARVANDPDRSGQEPTVGSAEAGSPDWVRATQTAALFKALAHPARVRVLEVLSAGRCSVGGLAQILGLEISHLSHELAILRRADLVDRVREGNTVHYSLRQPTWSQLLAMVANEMLTDLNVGGASDRVRTPSLPR